MTVLVRGLPVRVHQKIRKIARFKNLSTNQVMLEALDFYLKKKVEEDEKERERKQVFRRIRELREKMHKKYGKMEDSWELIREMRNRR